MQPHSAATPLLSMRTELIASSQHCHSVDTGCKWTLNITHPGTGDTVEADMNQCCPYSTIDEDEGGRKLRVWECGSRIKNKIYLCYDEPASEPRCEYSLVLNRMRWHQLAEIVRAAICSMFTQSGCNVKRNTLSSMLQTFYNSILLTRI